MPLAYISLDGSQGQVPLFSAFIGALEEGNGLDGENEVLIAECATEQRYYAVEKVQGGIYALCALVQWVSLDDLGERLVKRRRKIANNVAAASEQEPWWKAASLAAPSTTTARKSLRPAMNLRLSIRSGSNGDAPVEPSIEAGPGPATKAAPIDPPVAVPMSSPTHHSATGDLRTQYLESLYISKAPLAYFVKGPLSRARAEQQSAEASATTNDLLELLRASVLPVKEKGSGAKIDTKYSASIPELIKEIPPGATEEDVSGQLKSALGARIKKSKRRKKINADGFFPGEEDFVMKWWITRESEELQGSLEDTLEKRIKAACATQKPREMQLQIIFILEILALDRQAKGDRSTEKQDGEEKTAQVLPAAPEEKKSQDFSKILDVLLEKLQIWETTSQLALDLNADTGSSAKLGGNGRGKDSPGNDCLRSFCTEIILPL